MVSHPITLQGFQAVGSSGSLPAPSILKRDEENFIPSILAELKTSSGRIKLENSKVDGQGAANETLSLYQPVHRIFHPVLLVARCQRFGGPRLDPQSIDSLGMVVRRKSGSNWQGWMREGERIVGWRPLASGAGNSSGYHEDWEPDADKRPSAVQTGYAALDARIARNQDSTRLTWTESTESMFVVAPDIIDAAKQTVLFGIPSLTSSELSEEGSPAPVYKDDDAFKKHLSSFLRASNTDSALPKAGQNVSSSALKPPLNTDQEMQTFVSFLRQLTSEFDLYGESKTAKSMVSKLDELRVPVSSLTDLRPAGTYLKSLVDILIYGSNSSIRMPLYWPARSSKWANEFRKLMTKRLQERAATIKPQESKFEDFNATYSIRCFIRVKREDGCPPRLIWSLPSPEFKIRAWYESSGRPPQTIALPDPNKAFLAKVKPNVAFSVPSRLMNMLNVNSPNSYIDGDAKDGSDIGLGWICSFSIPIITLCAFIVLNIFLSLLNIIFFWLPFLKICIPYPKKS